MLCSSAFKRLQRHTSPSRGTPHPLQELKTVGAHPDCSVLAVWAAAATVWLRQVPAADGMPVLPGGITRAAALLLIPQRPVLRLQVVYIK